MSLYYHNKIMEQHRNYKPINETMKRFKNRFAVKGDIIELLKFERELLKLGYINVKGKEIFDYRGEINNSKADYITIGIHTGSPIGTFIPAMNSGTASFIFDLHTAFDDAVKYAAEEVYTFKTYDGVIKEHGEVVYGTRPVRDILQDHFSRYRGQYINYITVGVHDCTSEYNWKWFSTEAARKKYIDSITPLLTTDDGIKKYVDDKCWCVKPDLTYYYIKNGLDERAPWPGYKYFNIEAAALKYIDDNKPTYSKKAIINALEQTVYNVKRMSEYLSSSLETHINIEKLGKILKF